MDKTWNPTDELNTEHRLYRGRSGAIPLAVYSVLLFLLKAFNHPPRCLLSSAPQLPKQLHYLPRIMSTKRKLDGADDEAAKRHSTGYNVRAPWLHDTKPSQGWRTLGERAVQPSLPLSNMVSALQDLIDPEFDPVVAVLDDEPRFLKPLPSRIAPEDLEFLRFRGALTIPESGLRNELLRCYIQWVHSFLPVLNLQEFLRCIAENDPNGNVSILLFQAVMFVATAFVDLKHLQTAGYTTRKNARGAFYTRLRV